MSFHNLNNSSLDDDYNNPERGKSSSSKVVEAYNSLPTKKSCRERNREKISADASSTEVVMSSNIWEEFPEELFEVVIARLPIAAIFLFRSVCRKWNSFPATHSFWQHYSEIKQRYPLFYTVTDENINSVFIYDPCLKKWCFPSIATPRNSIFIHPVASAGGLVCLKDFDNRMNIYVCNPLIPSFKKLPWPARPCSCAGIGMTLNRNSVSNGYKILLLENNGDYEVYDSVKNSWIRPENMPASIRIPLFLNCRSQVVAIENTLYFKRAYPDGIVSYDVASGAWQQFVIPSPLHSNDLLLAECGGEIMLVGLLMKDSTTCICVWELQKMTLSWMEVDRMPNSMCLEFYGKDVKMTCFGNHGLLLLSLRSGLMERLVSYDAAMGEWQNVPGYAPADAQKRRWIACGTTFDLCPTTSA